MSLIDTKTMKEGGDRVRPSRLSVVVHPLPRPKKGRGVGKVNGWTVYLCRTFLDGQQPLREVSEMQTFSASENEHVDFYADRLRKKYVVRQEER